MIEVKNLVKKYGDHVAVDHVSFHLEEGKIYGFLGPNGAGKSTTMNIMTGYIAATDGDVKINGFDIYEEPEKAKKCIGYLPELPPVYMDMTPYEYLDFVADLKKIPSLKKKKMIEDIIEKVQIQEVRNRLIKNLSKGYRQRVGLAQAIMGYPPIIILDEPTVGLDPKQIIEIRDLIRSLAKKHTIILSSHILSEISAMCDEVLIINKGKLVAQDRMDHLSELMSAKNLLQIVVKAQREKIDEVLSDFPGVEEYTITKEENGEISLEIVTDGEKDIREELSYALATRHCLIMSFQASQMSLEDIFLELTEEENAEKEPEQEVSAELEEAEMEDGAGEAALEEAEEVIVENGEVEED